MGDVSGYDENMHDKGYANTSFSYENGTSEPQPNGSSKVNSTSITPKVLTRDETMQILRMWKNIIVISISFTFQFTAFQSMANLQSSINSEAGLGTASLSVIYAAIVISCMFVPTVMIKKLTVKWTLAVSLLAYSTYIAAQFYPAYYTLIPGAIILGLGAAPMWSSKCTYLSQVGNKYAEIVGEKSEVIITRFFGVFFLFFQFSQVFGNLISSSVLSSGITTSDIESDPNVLKYCGANFCGENGQNKTENENLAKPEISKIYTIAGIYLGCSLISVLLIACLVDPLTRYGEKERVGTNSLSGKRLFVATFYHLCRNKNQILIIPLTFWSGIEQGFIGADFTQGYVSCALGIHNVGYVIICFGVCDAITSALMGPLVKRLGRIPIFVGGATLNVIMVIVLMTWAPTPDEKYVFFIVAGVWGIADAVWQTQINSLYGVLFSQDEEAAFSNYRLWESLGFIVAYIFNIYVCMAVKLWFLLIFLGIGMLGYAVVEFMERRKERRN